MVKGKILSSCSPEKIKPEGFTRGGLNVELREVYKIYRVGTIDVQALRGVTISFPKSRLHIIMGPSGSGKTSLLNIIGGIDKPTAGKVFIEDEPLDSLHDEILEKYRLCIVGFIFQSLNLIPVLDALENTLLPMIAYGVSRRIRVARAKWLLRTLGLEKRMHHRPLELSGGEQQRVAIAVALANDPPIILADEPTAELDYDNAVKIMKIFSDLSHGYGKTVIVSTHDPRITVYADNIVRLEDGMVKEKYKPGREASGKDLEEFIDYVNTRIRDLEEEIRSLTDRFIRGEIGFEEYDKAYLELSNELKALKRILQRVKTS